ncbi:hypothetical protein FA13DRAFT_1813157 [Coprinellus micaceus]|uniref:Uncharacterized protein n=1 Tax=Coprinellus micaceus TaxID=71717 RepID=A0A4Y7TF43_COPMI|nr:hypothetical protein FA13DRAFT_1813157 [Coprinellus micaceus]
MRVPFILLSTLLAAVVSVAAIANPQPAALAQPVHQLKQVTRRELAARAKYPEHFFDKREAEPSGEPGPENPCGTVPRRRRGLEYDQVLAPYEVVAFLKGRGQFTSENGTIYVGDHFTHALKRGQDLASRWPAAHRVFKKVKTVAGQSLLRISVPHYKRWKRTLTPGEVFWLSPRTYLRHEDVDEIERLLLEDPEFVDVELNGIRITRSFLEAALAY